MRVDILHKELFGKAINLTIPKLNIPEFIRDTSRQIELIDDLKLMPSECTTQK